MLFSIKFKLRNQNYNQETNLTPIYVRLTVNGITTTDFYSGVRCNPDKWIQKEQRIKGTSKDVIQDNETLINVRADLKRIINSLDAKGTANDVKRKYLEKEFITPSLVECFRVYLIEEKEKEGLNGKTIEKWKYSLNHLISFVGEKYRIEEIHKTFSADYYKHLISRNMSNNHAIRNISYLNTVLDYCVEKDWIIKNPLIRKKLKKDSAKPIYTLEPKQVQQIEQLVLKGVFAEVRDLFLFTCYTSLDNNEIKVLKPENIKDNVIEIYRGKGNAKNSLQIVPIIPKARQILDFYKYQLPIHQTHTLNRYLHVIEGLIECSFNLTTKVGRKTSGTSLLLNSVPLEVVSRILGHKSVTTTQKHYADILNKILILEKTKHLM